MIDRQPQIAQKSGSGDLRSDLEPLTTRFSELGTPLEATWTSGTFGDPDVPGPSTYWIDAVVDLQPDVAAALRADAGLVPADTAPDVVEGLRDALPGDELLVGDALDAKMSEGRFKVRAFLSVSSDVLVIVATGQ